MLKSALVLVVMYATSAVGEMVVGCEANRDNPRAVGIRAPPGTFAFAPRGNFSVCVRVQFSRLRRINIVYRMSGAGTRPLLQLELSVEKLRVVVMYQYKYYLLSSWLRPHHWYFVCVIYDAAENQFQFWIDGELLGTKVLTSTDVTPASDLTVGYIDPFFFVNSSLIGNVTQFNIWSRMLTPQEVEDFSLCRGSPAGDVIAWRREWEFRNASRHEVELRNLCHPKMSRLFRVFPPMTFLEGAYLCESLGGLIPTPTNLSQVTLMVAQAQALIPTCKVMWAGVTEDSTEGEWRFHSDGRLAPELPWAVDEPNGLHYENCGGFEAEGVVDDQCHGSRCPSCFLASEVFLTLRGSCETFVHNMKFLMTEEGDERTFVGYGDYRIVNNGTTWVWEDESAKEKVASLLPSVYNYPMGRRLWQLERPMCGQPSGEARTLLFSVCRPGEFSCDDGTCVPLDVRCDLKYDCRDHTDESNCSLVRLPSDYKSSVAPRSAGEAEDDLSLEVAGQITLENLRVDTSAMLLKVAFNLTLIWRDSRAVFLNLKEDSSVNQVEGTKRQVWVPTVTLLNAIHTTRDYHTHMTVLREGNATGMDSAMAEEVLLYPGRASSLVNSEKYLTDFTCDFYLARYPFDRQSCYLTFMLNSASIDSIKWEKNKSWARYTGGALLMEYSVGPATAQTDQNVLKVHVPLARRHGYAVINVYLPSLTMLMIGYLTLFFLKDNFEVRVMTALTTLLVMATLFSQVAASLPKTSYFKLVDIWLLFCIFSTFFIIVFHILIDVLRNRTKAHDRYDHLCHREILFTKERHELTRRLAPGPPHSDFVRLRKSSGLLHNPKEKRPAHSKRIRLRVSVAEMERFARIFMAIVFFIFNIIYWISAYAI